MKIRAKINEIKTKKSMQRISEPKSWFSEKTNKIDKCLEHLTKKKREKTQISNIRNEKRDITTNPKEIQGLIRDYFENLYLNKLENVEEMDKFLDTNDHPKLKQENINHLNRSTRCNEIERGSKSLPKRKV
jgi:hypothetical protein